MRPVLITGGTGTLGVAFARICERRGLACRVTGRTELDIADAGAVDAVLAAERPWLVVNAAGYVRVDDAEHEIDRCRRENAFGPTALARACRRRGVRLVTFSSDLVFDGAKRTPYEEHDAPAPLNVYGRSKAEAEQRVLEAEPRALVVRTSAFFGPWDPHNFVTLALRRLAAGQPVRAAGMVVSPTYVPDLVDNCLDLAIDGAHGIWHLSSRGSVTWAELARTAARLHAIDGARVELTSAAELGWRAPRPDYSALTSARGALLPPLEDALTRYLRDLAP